MPATQFDDSDRQLVIQELERLHNTRLQRVGRYRKLLCNQTEQYYCIVGGTGDWHGISEGIFDKLAAKQAFLIVAVKHSDRIEIYSGDFRRLHRERDELSHTSRGNYQFHLDHVDNRVCIRECDNYCLSRISTVSYPGHESAQNAGPGSQEAVEPCREKSQEIESMFEELEREEQIRLLKQLISKLG